MKIRYAAKTDVGMKRDHNEDYFSVIENDQLFLVCDGMGGHASGEVASKMAAETVGEFFQRTHQDEDATWPYKMDRSLSYLENRLAVAIRLANLRIYEAASRDPRYKGMGTTCVASLISSDKIHIAHAGDSRCYRIRGGKIEQLTRDHSLLEDYKDANPEMTEEEVKAFPHKNVITRALGMRDSIQVAIGPHHIATGDTYLMCTDGLSGMVDDPKMLEIILDAESIERAVSELVDAANRNGGVDNITTLLVQCRAN